MKMPSETPFREDTYHVYTEYLSEHLFPQENKLYVLERAHNHHRANRLLNHFIIRDKGPRKLQEKYPEHTDLIENNWKIIQEAISSLQKDKRLAKEVAIYLNLNTNSLMESEELTYTHLTVLKDLNSYRVWTWKRSEEFRSHYSKN